MVRAYCFHTIAKIKKIKTNLKLNHLKSGTVYNVSLGWIDCQRYALS